LTESVNGAVTNQYLSLEIASWLSSQVNSVERFSFGIGGQKLLAMVNNASTKTYPLPNPSKVNILVLNEDANGIFIDDYTASYNLQLMNVYISGAFKAGYDYVITWNGWYPRTPFDLFTPTADDLLRQKTYFDLANTANKLYSNKNTDMRNANNIGGAEAQAQNATYFNDYLHLKKAGYDNGLIPKLKETFNELFTF
jgi:pyruvate/2-oxoacid:ferredoxin oxidoreductase beta subunit